MGSERVGWAASCVGTASCMSCVGSETLELRGRGAAASCMGCEVYGKLVSWAAWLQRAGLCMGSLGCAGGEVHGQRSEFRGQ